MSYTPRNAATKGPIPSGWCESGRCDHCRKGDCPCVCHTKTSGAGVNVADTAVPHEAVPGSKEAPEATTLVSSGQPAPALCFTGPGFYVGILEADYHSGAFGPAKGSLSVTGGKVITKAPALFRWQQDNPIHSDHFDVGSAAHQEVLGIGPGIAIIPATSRAKADQVAHAEAKEAARAAGKIPLSQADYDRVRAMADKLSEHRLAMQLLSTGRPEVSAYALDEETGVWMRGRFDWLHPTVLTDYKTSVSSDPHAWAGRYGFVRKWGYDRQAAWYTDLARLLGHPAEAFAFITQMKEPPYLVTVVRVPDEALHDARAANREALQRFRDCAEADRWDMGYLPDDTCAVLSLTDQTFDEEVIA